jgi:hypothetical protein
VAIQAVDILTTYIESVMLDGDAAEGPRDRFEETTR